MTTAAGALYAPGNRLVYAFRLRTPIGTSNQAEYWAFCYGLGRMADFGGPRPLHVYADSALVIQQVKGAWSCKHEGLKKLHSLAKEYLRQLRVLGGTVSLSQVPRSYNALADALAARAFFEQRDVESYDTTYFYGRGYGPREMRPDALRPEFHASADPPGTLQDEPATPLRRLIPPWAREANETFHTVPIE